MVVHTYKELLAIAGNWPTVQVNNNYVIGSKFFTITYEGKSVTYQNEDRMNVAGCAHNYNGLSHRDYMKFRAEDFKDHENDKLKTDDTFIRNGYQLN